MFGRELVLKEFGNDFFAQDDVDDSKQPDFQQKLPKEPRRGRNPINNDFRRSKQGRLERCRAAGHDSRARVSNGVVGFVGDDGDRTCF